MDVQVTDEHGRKLEHVRVYADDALLQAEPDGRSYLLEPGEHELRVEAEQYQSVTQSLALTEAERRPIHVRLQARTTGAAASPAPPVRDPTPREDAAGVHPAIYWSLAGVTLAGAVTFVYFGLKGNALREDLDACRPRCEDNYARQVLDESDQYYLVADVALAIGAASGITMLGLWLFHPRRDPAAEGPSVQLDAGPHDLRVRLRFAF